MALQVFGSSAVVSMLNRAFADTSIGNAFFNNQVAQAGSTATSQTAFAQSFGAQYAGQTADALSTLLMTNLGLLPNAELQTALAGYITSVGTGNVGIVALQLGQILSGLEGDATYGAAATAWNTEVNNAFVYSSNSSNTNNSTGANVVTGQVFTLTTGMDSASGGSSSDQIYGSLTGSNDTFNAYDAINGGAGNDSFSFTLGSNYDGGGNISNIETFAIKATGANYFDFNGIEGVESINSDRSTNVLTAKNIASTATKVGFNVVSNTTADLVAIFTDSALNGTNDTVTVSLTGGVGSSASGAGDNEILVTSTASTNGAENLTVNVTGGAAYIGKLESEENSGDTQVLKKLTVTGDSNLKIGTGLDFAGTAGTIDASAFTGGLTVIASDGVDHSITGGTGNDSFDMTINLTVADTINGGDGIDTVKVNADTVTLASLTLSNIENIYQEATAGNVLSLVTGGTALTKVTLVENDTTSIDLGVTDLAAGVAVELANNVNDQDMGIASLGLKDASGTADALTVSVLGTSGQAAEKVEDIAFTNIETLNLVSGSFGTTAMLSTDTNDIDDISADAVLTTINASGAVNLEVSVGGEATKLTKFDGSAMTANLSVTLATGDVSVTGGSGDDTFVFGATLNNKDSVVGGGNTKTTTEDTLTATVTSLTATTGALTIAGVERINLTNAGTATVGAAAITGATEIGFLSGATTTTVTGLAAGTAIGIGHKGTDEAGNKAYATIDAALADATGTADSLTFNLNNVDTGNAGDVHTVTLKTTGIETVNLAYSTTLTALSSYTVTSTNLKAATVNVTGSTADTGNTVDLGTVSSTTTKVDGSTFKGVLKATASSGVATTFLTDGAQADSLTGSTGIDTFTIGSTSVKHTLDGGAGNDTLNITLANGTTDMTATDNFEVINITVAASAAANTTAAANKLFNDTDADVVNILGGNSLSTYNSGSDGIDHTGISKIDASTFAGKIDDITFDSNTLTSATSVIGGAGNDTVSATFSAFTANNALKLTNIDNLDVTLASTANTLDLASVTGLSTIKLGGAPTTANTHTLSNLGTSTVVQIGNAVGTALGGVAAITIKADLASVTGTTDSVTFKLVDTNDQNSTDYVALQADGVETINLDVGTGAESHRIKLVDTNATNKVTVNLTGGIAGDGVEFASDGIVADVTVINASTLLHNLVMADSSRTGTTAMTITGGDGNDTIIMKNASDVLGGGSQGSSGQDTLKIVDNFILGGTAIDLSSTVDQVTTYNGSANAAVQSGFESVDLSGITGSNGADVTAHSTGSAITGTSNADVIRGGAGVDTIVGGEGGDVMSGGASLDSFDIANTITIGGTGNAGTITGYDQITDFAIGTASANSETLNLAGTAAIGADTSTNVDSTLTIAGGAVTAHAIAGDGEVTFTGGPAADGVDSVAILAAAVQYLTLNDIGSAGDTVWMTGQISGVNHTFVYTQTAASDGATGGYDLVDLVGVLGTSISGTNGTTAGLIYIA